ncbi:Low-specificity L-threonine aldolase (EC [Olavius algarvensis associated proteobacterium Delta 3]|nr:Low-specificity L-threonine aldolase (EC [Olavius algarvensis associated proteobacterium Delta 3]
MGQVDLRSDTVTQPTPGMRRAMAEARVGDDVFGEDPTVIELEEMAAGRTGKEASLLVASGTMANLVCQLSHCQRGDEMILGDQSHMFYYEQGGSSALGGIHPHTVPNQPDGRLSEEAVENAVRADDVHFPVTRLIALENTHNRCSGSPLSPEYTHAVGEIARRNGLALHIDGARIFNAAISLGVPVRDLTADADSVSFCLSKGLCAPVGSLVCGSREFVNRARRIRKVLGGGMRQAEFWPLPVLSPLTKWWTAWQKTTTMPGILQTVWPASPGYRSIRSWSARISFSSASPAATEAPVPLFGRWRRRVFAPWLSGRTRSGP